MAEEVVEYNWQKRVNLVRWLGFIDILVGIGLGLLGLLGLIASTSEGTGHILFEVGVLLLGVLIAGSGYLLVRRVKGVAK